MRKLKKVLPVVLSAAMVAQSFAISAMAAPAVGVADDGMYYTDFNPLADAQAAAADIAKEIAAEGDVLMKNEAGALPMAGGEFISLFGVSQDAMAGQSGNYSFAADPNNMQIREALEAEGFKVNRTLSSYYETIPTSFGQEVTQFNKGIENSFSLYKDAAVIVLSRGGGEGSDMATVTGEEASEEDIAAHAGYQAQADGKIYKHFLQLTDSEKALLEYVKAQDFKKIIYLVNCSEIFELGDLQNDEDVDAILWIGRPGQVGSISAAGILSGRINPSGKTVDTWYRDFTADPTWQNAINNAQVNSSVTYVVAGQAAGDNNEQAGIGGSSNAYHGVDYEEGIYVGYRYYETRGLTDGEEWYQNAVVYPFGYGLSYTNFSYSGMKVVMEDGTAIEDGATVEAAKLASSVEAGPAAVKTFTVCVDVTNEGAVAGKETVEIYVQAPYTTGEVEKAHVKLVGFGKTDKLLPGQTQTLEITVNVQDMASYDATDANGNGTKGYELDEGAYTLYAIANAHGWADPDAARYQAVNFNLDADAYLQLDDFSGNEIKNLFSIENGLFYSLRTNDGKYAFNADVSAKETQLSRADWEGTFPQAPTEADVTISEQTFKALQYWDNFKADDTANYGDGKTVEGIVYEVEGYPSDYPWMADQEANAERMASWKQTGEYGIELKEMTGIDFTDEVIEEGRFAGKTGNEAWDEFMNTLTWQDEMDLVGQLQKRPFDAVKMNQLNGQDSAWNYASTFNFTCNTILAATWNTNLSRTKGILIGNMALLSGNNTWWGNSANTHRSPFGGRVFEYPSEDGYLAGMISGNETLGAVSRGLTTYMKHCALNDQETFRNGLNLFAWVSEQAMREIYFKSFQICAQEGQSTGFMGAFARAGRVSMNVNYNFCTALFRKEWGCDTISSTTDAYGGMRACSPLDMLVRAGTDNIATNTMSGTWDAEKNMVVLGEEKIESPIHWFVTREMAKVFLWVHANSAMNKNGVDFSAWTVDAQAVQQGVEANLNVAADVEADKIEYVVLNGTLPSGLTLNADGTITGTSTAKAGTYNVTVQGRADNWVTANRPTSIEVESAFTIDETEGAVDEEFYAVIESDIVTAEKYSDGVKYYVKDGKLPAGLALNEEGEIEGTPEAAGEYTFTVGVDGSYTVRQGWSRVVVSDSYEYDVTLTIAE